ncbi:MAG: hypothetical protein D6717_11245 [Gammaproteobacteria bacterium]|nr:MAG: hypothetical protein D6717_11245 [Gammaproteobacteria bacterium]
MKRLSFLLLALACTWPLQGAAHPPQAPDARHHAPEHALLLDYRHPMRIPGTACTVTLTDYRWAPCPQGMRCVHAGTETVGLLLEGPGGLQMRMRTRRIIGQGGFQGRLQAGGVSIRVEATEPEPARVLIQVRQQPGGGPCAGLPR